MKIKILALIMLFCVLFSSCAQSADKDNNSKNPAAEQTSEDSAASAQQGSGLVPESSRVDRSYFDDAAFVGDSVSLKLNYYNASTSELGNAKFFTSGSLGAANALWEVSGESVHPSYQGTKMLIEDCIANSGAKKVFIMLGMNDIGLYSKEESIENYKELVGRILKKSPDAVIFIQSMTPITANSNRSGKKLNNDSIREYNGMLLEMCEEMGWYYLDVASVMYDDNGALKVSYCSDADDMGMHFTNEGCQKWADYLKTHAINAQAFPEKTPEAVG